MTQETTKCPACCGTGLSGIDRSGEGVDCRHCGGTGSAPMPADQSGTTPPATLQDSIAAEAAHYLLTMYPTAQAGRHPSMLRGLRAVIARDVLSAMRLGGKTEAREWIAKRARHRREINRLRKLGEQGAAVRGDTAATAVFIDQLMSPQEIDHAE